MEKYHIKLTESEAAILAKIDLRESHRNHDEGHAAYKANAQPILALLQSLSDRSAVPPVAPSTPQWRPKSFSAESLIGTPPPASSVPNSSATSPGSFVVFEIRLPKALPLAR